MITLVCSKCKTMLPVEESKIGTRLFICPKCAEPLDTAHRGGEPQAPKLETSEDKTLAPDVSALYIQQKLKEVAAKRAQPISPVAPVMAPVAQVAQPVALSKSGFPKGVTWGGVAVVGVVIVAATYFATKPPATVPQPQAEVRNLAPEELPEVKNPKNEKKPTMSEPVTVASLIQTLKGGKHAERKKALSELSAKGPEARTALAVVLDMTKELDPELRTLAGETLNKMGPVSKEDVKIYAAALRDPSPELRIRSTVSLASLGKEAKGEIAFLRVLTLDENETVKASAEKAVRMVEEDLLENLIKGLQDKAPNVRVKSAQELSEMGGSAKPALPNLMESLGDKNAAVRLAVVEALLTIGPEAVMALGESLRDKNVDVRLEAIHVLGKMGPDARPVMSDLIAGLTEKNARVKDATLQSILKIGDYAIPYLVASLEREKAPAGQKPYIEALEKMGPDAAPFLKEALKMVKPDATTTALLKKVEASPPPVKLKLLTGQAGLYQGQLISWFNTTDADKNEFLGKEELARMLRGAGAKPHDHDGRKVTAKDFGKYPDYAFITRLDRDNDGKISRAEFDIWARDYAQMMKKDADDRAQIAKVQQKLAEKSLTQAMRQKTESALQQQWASYRNWRRMQGAVNHAEWMQRWVLTHVK